MMKDNIFLKGLKTEWKGLIKPTPKQLTISTFRTVGIAVISAAMISLVDLGFTQIVLQITKLF